MTPSKYAGARKSTGLALAVVTDLMAPFQLASAFVQSQKTSVGHADKHFSFADRDSLRVRTPRPIAIAISFGPRAAPNLEALGSGIVVHTAFPVFPVERIDARSRRYEQHPILATGSRASRALSLNFGDIHAPFRSFTVCKLICVSDEKRELFRSPLTDDHSRPAGSRMSCA